MLFKEQLIHCINLKQATNLSIKPQNINPKVFDSLNLNSITLIVSACALNAYQNADVWKNFGTIIGDEQFTMHGIIWNNFTFLIVILQK